MRKRQKREALLAAKLALLCLFVLAAAEYGTLFRDGPVDASARRSVGGQQQVDVRVDPSGMEVEVPPGMEVEFSHPMITGPGRVRIFKYVERGGNVRCCCYCCYYSCGYPSAAATLATTTAPRPVYYTTSTTSLTPSPTHLALSLSRYKDHQK
jgi:hypothetical protein